MDRITPEQRSKLMSMIRGRDTLPEMIVRKALHAKGWRFRVCDKRFAGRPDVVIPKAKTIIDSRPPQTAPTGASIAESRWLLR